MLHMLHIRSTHDYKSVTCASKLERLYNLFVFLVILNAWIPFTVAVKTNLRHMQEK